MSDGLRLMRMPFDVRNALRIGGEVWSRRLEVDLGYLAHCRLVELFGDLAPRPFFVDSGRQGPVIFGYTSADQAALLAAGGAAMSESERRLETKVIPTHFEIGTRLGFEVRVCPVVRLAKESEGYRKGAEKDVYLRELSRLGDAVPGREEVYRRWLGERFGSAASLVRCEMKAYQQREPLFRQGRVTEGKRERRVFERPDVTFEGVLEVRDVEGFAGHVKRGIGRHRGFGFGMVLLKRPEVG
ncbi:MAG: type I-E CRISPR-associated protein Cas6/Cse3/CasE [Deltaproteobacteria bacterium]|nr:type I-E CRISPR-associated protein Cas6/Cse3/CasE [Deltaproteobacteria bacterium]